MDLLRQVVGGPKNRYKSGQYNLDLTYITPRLIAMAFPASGIQKMYRNSIDDVSNFLKQQHGNAYIVINLSGREVDESKLLNVLSFDWQDHQAPPLSTLFAICDKMTQFLNGNQERVALVHCNHGKGRTGTIICCFLLFCKMFKDTYLVKEFYAKKRFEKQEGFGVTQPCQIQFIKYFQQILHDYKNYPRVLTIKKVVFKGQHKYPSLYFKVKDLQSNRVIITTKKSKTNSIHNNISESQINFKILEQKYFAGDIRVTIKAPTTLGSNTVASYSFNTAFITTENQVTLTLSDLSPYSLQKTQTFDKDFKIIITFKQICECLPNVDFHLRCQKCRDKVVDEEQKWKVIKNAMHRREKLSQNQMFQILGFKDQNKKQKLQQLQKQLDLMKFQEIQQKMIQAKKQQKQEEERNQELIQKDQKANKEQKAQQLKK